MGRLRGQLPPEIYMIARADGLEVWAALTLQHPPGVAAPVYVYLASDGARTLTGILGPLTGDDVGLVEDEVLRRVLGGHS